MTITWTPVYQQLFLFMHEPDGSPRVAPDLMAPALAGATLAELVLAENIRVDGDRFYVYSDESHPDPVAAATLAKMVQVDGTKQVTPWLRALTGDIYDRVSGGLLAADMVKREVRRRDTRYVLTDPNIVGLHLGRLREATYSRATPSQPVLVLCGFVAMLRIHQHLQRNVPAGELLDTLNSLFIRSDPGAQDVVHRTGDLIANAGVRPYR